MNRHSSKRPRPDTVITQPEIRLPPLTDPPASSGKKETKKTRETLPSPGITRKSNKGRYAVHDPRKHLAGIQGLVNELVSTKPEERAVAAKKLKLYANDAEKAREVCSLLPPDSRSAPIVSLVRAHCIALIKKELR